MAAVSEASLIALSTFSEVESSDNIISGPPSIFSSSILVYKRFVILG
jgi:hypothetical protein